MIRACLPAVVVLLAAAAWALPQQTQAQINRCTAPDGTSIYTDRECSALGAEERLPRDREGAAAARRYRGGCARSVHQLIREMTAAFDLRDVNRLAGVYHWPGTSHAAGHGMMDRLDGIAQQQVIDIVAVRAATPVRAAQRPGLSATMSSTLQMSSRSSSPPPARSPPVALRVHQSVGQGAAPSRTTFTLRQHLDCWWISL